MVGKHRVVGLAEISIPFLMMALFMGELHLKLFDLVKHSILLEIQLVDC